MPNGQPHVPHRFQPMLEFLLRRVQSELGKAYSIEQLPAWHEAHWLKNPDALYAELDRASGGTAHQSDLITQAKIILLLRYRDLWTITRVGLLLGLTRAALRHKTGVKSAREATSESIKTRNREMKKWAEAALEKNARMSATAIAKQIDKKRVRKEFEGLGLLPPPKKIGTISKIIGPTVNKFKTDCRLAPNQAGIA